MRFTILAFALMGLVSTQADAAVIYSYATDSPTYTGSIGSPVTVSVYLVETLTAGSTSYITSQGGLAAGGAGINNAAGVGNASIVATNLTTGSFMAPSGFGGPLSVDYNQGGGSNLEFDATVNLVNTPIQPLVPVTAVNSTTNHILLGTFSVDVGSIPTTYVLTSLFDDTINGGNSIQGQTNSNTIAGTTSGGVDLDKTGNPSFVGANAAAPYSFTVSATTPEPASVGLLGFAAGALLLRRGRRTA